MSYQYITGSIAAGGVLSISGPITRNRIVVAKMFWEEDGDTIKGGASLSIIGALDNLELALRDEFENKKDDGGAGHEEGGVVWNAIHGIEEEE